MPAAPGGEHQPPVSAWPPGAGAGPDSPWHTRKGPVCQTQSRSPLLGTRYAARCDAAWYLIQLQFGDWMLCSPAGLD